MTTKRFWTNTWQYRRIMEILEDYWLTEPEEDFVQVDMDFIKGKEFQSKRIIWYRDSIKMDYPDPVSNMADVLKAMEVIKPRLNEFAKNISEELGIDEYDVWEHIEHYSKMYFINRYQKAIEENDKD